MDENDQSKFLVPFGKYKGQPLQVLEEDESYANWIVNQDSIKIRYPTYDERIIFDKNLISIWDNEFEEK